MPRLQILQHKSYHPYNEKNKARVREDEARAREEEERAERRAIEAEGEVRLAALRKRAGSPSGDVDPTAGLSTTEVLAKHQRERERELKAEKRERKERDRLDFDWPSEKDRYRKRDNENEHGGRGRDRDLDRSGRDEQGEDAFRSDGHVNFWADLESGKAADVQVMPRDAAQRRAAQEADKLTMYLERPERETRPWYTDADLRRYEELDASDIARERRERDQRRDRKAKNRNDPLAQISSRLAAKKEKPRPAAHGQSEKERALAMLAKRRGEAAPRSDWAERFEHQQASAGDRYTRR